MNVHWPHSTLSQPLPMSHKSSSNNCILRLNAKRFYPQINGNFLWWHCSRLLEYSHPKVNPRIIIEWCSWCGRGVMARKLVWEGGGVEGVRLNDVMGNGYYFGSWCSWLTFTFTCALLSSVKLHSFSFTFLLLALSQMAVRMFFQSFSFIL